MCPYCRTAAPLVYRGVTAVCAACGRPRPVLSASSVTYAGKGARVGASVVRAFGWVGLVFGLFVSLLLGLLVGLFTTAVSGLVTFGVFALFTAFVFWLVRRGGKALDETGQEALEARQDQALFALAATHGGRVHPMQAAAALDMTVEQADAVLTRLNRARPLEVEVELTDDGQIFYSFTRLRPPGVRFEPRFVRVDRPVRVESQRPAPEVIDAELVTEEPRQRS
jgi:hypothetical protein